MASYPEFPASLKALEEALLETWRSEDLFERTQQANAEGTPFVFFEGPPTANGRPGLHHILSRTIKDLICRHRALQGRQVTRIAGWDTHGLPVEIEAEKKLGISGKPEIEALGMERFNQVCRDSVFTYKEEWERLSERMGYWLDYEHPYVTFHNDYIESVWAIVKQLADRGLLYRGHKSVPYCPRCGTALSSHEVAQGYKDVDDPSLTFLAPVLDEHGEPDGRHFAVWTTTPWTVPSNSGLAVHPDLTYVEAEVSRDAGQGVSAAIGAGGRDDHTGPLRLIVARDRAEAVLGEDYRVVREFTGGELVGLRYARPVEWLAEPADPMNGWTVVAEDFVSADDGTGIVHMAPAFGADDYAAGQRHGLPMFQPLDDAGCFEASIEGVGGRFVKDADPYVVEHLADRGLLWRHTLESHNYPHCWRCSSPLIYIARASWFAATSTLKDQMLANNAQVGWHPPEVGEKRFGEWLRGNVDWALSRDRYWGTPLPVWVCDADEDHLEWVGSFATLAERSGRELGDDFDPHRPFIDDYTWACTCEGCSGTMRRTPSVMDVWFDSGAMPYAQWHYPFENQAEFEAHFPADYICEGLDQTRGWFYSLMAISTMLGRGPAFRNVIVNDLVLDAEGQKMSKSKGNTVNPWDAIDDHGIDALRWYFMTVSNPWVPTRFDPEGVRESTRKYFDTLANTYRFFALYAGTESWQPSEADPAPAERGVLDRWLLSRLATLVEGVSSELDGYQITRAYRLVVDFVDELSNWYVRRSRARFWGNEDAADQRAAFRTLYDALRTVAILTAPVTPFVADWLHRSLTGSSVHLQRFPGSEGAEAPGTIDAALESEMASARELVSLGRAAREEVRLRVRQPLARMQAVVPSGVELRPEILEVVRDELNVKDVAFLSDAAGLVTLTARPNYRGLGPRFGKQTNDAANVIRALDQQALAAYRAGEPVEIEVHGARSTLEPGDLEVIEEAEGSWAVKAGNGHVAALDPELTPELEREGRARELVNRLQRLRKDSGLEITDRIEIGIYGPDEVQEAAREWADFIAGEVLALGQQVGALDEAPVAGEEAGAANAAEARSAAAAGPWQGIETTDLDGIPAVVALRRASVAS
jgi:isoleucyl-tRNA synthetase